MGREGRDTSEEICFSEEGMPFFLFIYLFERYWWNHRIPEVYYLLTFE